MVAGSKFDRLIRAMLPADECLGFEKCEQSAKAPTDCDLIGVGPSEERMA